ncbi:hypothetical protein ACG6P0_002007 [Enterococcus hirae]|uniref:Uncharacterized protein n=5 Tax=Enterococcus hirae TaxID=1354 RepID=I6TDB8_ENTHA|nr:hypothetical protein [Enterococcus hirae]OWW67783.1 hypothetical protein C655_08130 [Enterococcus hirae 57-09-G6]AFM71459.1 hypothetical protein EHR_12980 [Enterococcus hirae ATCC 9790]EMF0044900.1 hypothetical protein [Enterococcus hirae]EMF0054220.1 hypothetical protein [Enterococcus hirae]EMF0069752.1 hypothetical protein [Enterococcus hirae]
MKEWYEGFYFTKDEINSQRKITEKAKQALNVKHEYSSASKVAKENYEKENKCLEYMKSHHQEEKDQSAFSAKEIDEAKVQVYKLEMQHARISDPFGNEALKISEKLKYAKNRYNHMENINKPKVQRQQKAKETEQAAANLGTLQALREQREEPDDKKIKVYMDNFKKSNNQLEAKYNNLTTNSPDKNGKLKENQFEEITNTVQYVKDNKHKMSLLDKKESRIQDKLSNEKESRKNIKNQINEIDNSSFFNKIIVYFTGEKRDLTKKLDTKDQNIVTYNKELSTISVDKAAYIMESEAAIDKMLPISQEKQAELNALKTNLKTLMNEVNHLSKNTQVTQQIDPKFKDDLTNLENSNKILSEKIKNSIKIVQNLADQKKEFATMRGQSTFIDLKENAKEKQSEIVSQGKQPEKSKQPDKSERGSSFA